MIKIDFHLAKHSTDKVSITVTSNGTCDATSVACMTQECETCVSLIDEFAPQSSVTLQCYQWKSKDNRIEKVVTTDSMGAVFNELKKQLSTFLLHTCVKT